jgi:hypothetical protein
MKKPRVTQDQHGILREIAHGWHPYPWRLSGAENALLRRGLVRKTLDEQRRDVLEITEDGMAAILPVVQ